MSLELETNTVPNTPQTTYRWIMVSSEVLAELCQIFARLQIRPLESDCFANRGICKDSDPTLINAGFRDFVFTVERRFVEKLEKVHVKS